MPQPFFEIPYYHDYLSPNLAIRLLDQAQPAYDVPGLEQVGTGGGLESRPSMEFLVELYKSVKPELARVLRQRIVDRKFIDERTAACNVFNQTLQRDVTDKDYKTIIGLEDANGRIVLGPKSADYCRKGGRPVAPLPDFLKGPHVTLFGPPDSAKMAINAMNSYHRRLATEPAIVEKLLANQTAAPMWGADDEDSKTPLRADLIDASVNLTKCFSGTLSLREGEKIYALAASHLAQPIKRFPGLALPCSFLFFGGNPIPLHLYDFALHLFHNWHNPRALVFYVPKLENEEEAAYVHLMIETAERLINQRHAGYKPGTVRLMIVLENPRAIVRAHEIMDALHPYFAGASLGWHDYLASTARIFKEDSQYRIPVKADPDIVIKYIKASHQLLAEAVGSRGGIKVGGMYGILPASGPLSLQMTLKGFIKDAITQMKRDLTGFWVAHPDFVRLGLALVEAWRLRLQGDPGPLTELVRGLLDAEFHDEILRFIDGPDIQGLDSDDPNYVRSLIVADIKESDFIANNHPDEIRYNVFQSLQYLTDWLSGNGCVALPTNIGSVPVRVMDDLATAERSRWEVWHELYHGRFSIEDFIQIVFEEMNFIRRDLSDGKKIVQVKWGERTSKWYPIALRIMLQLMTHSKPAEFATELLIPFTVDAIRNSEDPWAAIQKIDGQKYRLDKYIDRLAHYFEICGTMKFAQVMAKLTVEDLEIAERLILGFNRDEVAMAASFHGDIGQTKSSLDSRAAAEQARVLNEQNKVREQLRELGEEYRTKFSLKFLISAQGKSADEILQQLDQRLKNSPEQELQNARLALWEISRKRMTGPVPAAGLADKIEALRQKHNIIGASIAINDFGQTQVLSFGTLGAGQGKVTPETCFELASLSKPLASAFALEYFREKGIPLHSSVNQLLARTKSTYRIRSPQNPDWADAVTIENLLDHTALNTHYVNGFRSDQPMPGVLGLIAGEHGYKPIEVIHAPGSQFQYSGGGFMVLEHLIEAFEGESILRLTRKFFDDMGAKDLGFELARIPVALGHLDSGDVVPSGRLNFPAFAAGALGTSASLAQFLLGLTHAFQNPAGSAAITHDTAVTMLHGVDKGSHQFMGCKMGLGIFTAEAGENRLAIHQGANDGFRALFIQCYQGPDAGKGLVAFCNADNRGVLFLAEAAREILTALSLSGMNLPKLTSSFKFSGLKQEQIVNLGYKALIFDGFLPDLPEPIVRRGPLDPLSAYNLATSAEILGVSNQKFARAENLISARLPTFDPELFGRQGKIMDSWETARHNPHAFDSLVLGLKDPSALRYLSFSTKFHDGNQAQAVRVFGLNPAGQWEPVLPRTALDGHSLLQLDLKTPTPEFSQVRIDMFPDGGLTRLGLFAELPETSAHEFKPLTEARPIRFSEAIPKTKRPQTIPYLPPQAEIQRNLQRTKGRQIDLASAAFGGTLLQVTNEHYGPAAQVISPFPPIHMFDGLESARSRTPGHFEEVTIRLGAPTRIQQLILDFRFFVNNNPRSIEVQGLCKGQWIPLVADCPVKAFAGGTKTFSPERPEIIEQVRVRIHPDGGINRIKVMGPNPLA